MKFKVGDKVIVIDGSAYSITRTGSEGIIVGFSHYNDVYVDIEFYKLTGSANHGGRPGFRIFAEDIAILENKLKEIKQYGIVKFMEGVKCK
jgi:hypothetical protein